MTKQPKPSEESMKIANTLQEKFCRNWTAEMEAIEIARALDERYEAGYAKGNDEGYERGQDNVGCCCGECL